MLQQLLEYSAKKGFSSEPGFGTKVVPWAIQLDGNGGFLGISRLGDDRGMVFDKAPIGGTELQSGGKSNFLWESAQTVVLLTKNAQPLEGSERQKTFAKHAYFLSLIEQALPCMPELAAIRSFLVEAKAKEETCKQLLDAKAKPTDAVTFRVDGAFPLSSRVWHEWWRDYRRSITTDKGGAKAKSAQVSMICLLSGEPTEPALTHEKIKGLADVGGQPTGDVVIGFDKSSFQSFGLAQSTNAAVSPVVMASYREALNFLLADRHATTRLVNTKVVHWFKEEVSVENDPLAWLADPDASAELAAQRSAQDLLRSVQTAKQPAVLLNRYFSATLSGAAGRIMVRDYAEGSFEDLRQNIIRWFEDFAIVGRDGGRLAPRPKFLATLGALGRELDEVAAPLVSKLWRCALQQEAIPHSAMALALRRTTIDIISDTPVNHARMGLLKAFHLRNNPKGGRMEPYLNVDHPEPAYQCGRLLAVLAALQRSALGDVGAGVVQRYYTAASQTPALVFGRLVANAKNHLQKLEGGLPWFYEEKISEVMGHIGDRMPKTLELEQQSLFALGYYQQLAFDRAKKSKSSEPNTEATNAKAQ